MGKQLVNIEKPLPAYSVEEAYGLFFVGKISFVGRIWNSEQTNDYWNIAVSFKFELINPIAIMIGDIKYMEEVLGEL